jgi:predicted lipid-binding transport protein (Tim44 family)
MLGSLIGGLHQGVMAGMQWRRLKSSIACLIETERAHSRVAILSALLIAHAATTILAGRATRA